MADSRYERVDGRAAPEHSDRLDTLDDFESDEEELPRTSTELRQHDQETINAEEEAEQLLAGNEERQRGIDPEKWRRKKQKRKNKRWRSGEVEESELMFKVEEGATRSSDESSANSSEVDLQKLKRLDTKQKKSKSKRFGKFALIHMVIIIAFLTLLYGAYRASQSFTKSTGSDSPASEKVKLLSNGTHDFAATTILISLDGFRADFVHRGLTPTLSSFIKQGVSPKYMMPSFPSLTFPNHYTLVTGLYPQDHGIVGNTFWDPDTQREFYYTDYARSMDPNWWNSAEPIWETAELQGLRSAIHMWPGSEAHIGTTDPTFVDKFNGEEHLDVKVRRILGWLDLPGPKDAGASDETPRPQLIAAYVPNVDTDGHKYGPNSTYIRSTIAEVDGMLGSLFHGIEDRNLTDVVNVVIVSDHGMATTSNHRLIQLEDLIDPDLIEHTDGWPLYGLRPKDKSHERLMEIHDQLVAKSQLPQYHNSFDVYLRDQDMPERYNFHANNRIAPLWIVPKVGWAIVTKEEFNVETALEQDLVYNPIGLHGYDHEHPLMSAIFVARGPAFPHPQGSQVEPFQNIELYNIVCDSLGLEPRPNNGTIRLPFKTMGLHDLEKEPPEIPDDPPVVDTGSQLLPPSLPGIDKLPPVEKPDAEEDADIPEVEIPEVKVPGGKEDGGDFVQDEKQAKTWSEWINQKLDSAKSWASGLFGGSKDEPQSAEDTRHGEDW